MVSFDGLCLGESGPIYLQIMRHIKAEIVAGTIGNGEEMPSRRVLSALLGVNPNTIQKAYHLLEEEGIVESRAGAKSYLTVTAAQTAQIRAQLLEGEVDALIQGMQSMGVTKAETLDLVDTLWDRRV